MKKLLLSAVAVFGLLPGLTSTASADVAYVAEDRSGWIISGCSNETGEGAGLGTLDAIKDGNTGTYWHSVWNLSHNAPNHYFVVDRGETLAQTALSAVGYTPRQTATNGNGYVRECDIYILDSVEGLNLVASSNSNSICEGGHNIEDFVASLTPTGHGSFTYTYNDNVNRGESKVEFSTPTAGRYILFVATETNGDSNNQSYGNVFCNCAEFNAYTEEEEVDLTQKVQLPGSGLVGVTELVNGQEYLIYDTFSGRNGFHYVESGNTSQVKKTQIGLDATNLLDLSYVWVAEEVEGGWKFVNKDCEQYIKPLTWWNNDGVDGTGGIFEVTYNNDSESTFTIKNTTSDGYYWSGDDTYLAGDAETGKHPFMFIEAAPLYTGSVPVILTYPAVGGESGKVTIDVPVGTSIDEQGLVPVPNFFTMSGIAEEDKVVSGTNNQFTVEGTWAFPFEIDQVYRIDIRQKSTQHGCSNLLYEAGSKKVNTRNTTNQDAFIPERLFYLDGKGFDATTGNLIVTLHSIAADAATGFEVTSGNNAVGVFSATPTEFRVVTNSNGTSTGISLQHPESATCHVNDLSNGLGVWHNALSQNDAGSFLRFFALTDSDFEGLSSREDAYLFSQENIDAAKTSKSAADVRTLFAGTVIVANANALLSSISSGYTPEHFGDDPGYLYGSDYNTIAALAATLQEAIAGQDIAAIEAAYETLAAEVAKVQIHMPEAGKFYRFKGHKNGKYITPAGSGKMAQAEVPTAYSVFRFEEVEGSDDTFRPINVKCDAGIIETHSLTAEGVVTDTETYRFVASMGKIPGAFTVISSYSGSQYLHDNGDTADRYGAYDSTEHATNWYLEEVNEDGTTGIEEIAVESNKAQGIYDLQGRRLSAPVKGINIINGKKVLVK